MWGGGGGVLVVLLLLSVLNYMAFEQMVHTQTISGKTTETSVRPANTVKCNTNGKLVN